MVEQGATTIGSSPDAGAGAGAVDRPELLEKMVEEAVSRPEILTAARSAQLSPERLREVAEAAKQGVWSGAASQLAELKRIEAAQAANIQSWQEDQSELARERRLALGSLASLVALGVISGLALSNTFRGLHLNSTVTTAARLTGLLILLVSVFAIGPFLRRWVTDAQRTVLLMRRFPSLWRWLVDRSPTRRERLSRAEAGNPSYEELKRQKEIALAQLTEAVVERGLISHLRSAINQGAGASYATEISIEDAPGLSEVYDNTFGIPTNAADRVRMLMLRMRGASIGISGPRGAGKTTLLRSFCDPTFAAAAETEEPRPALKVMVSAPVEYEPREFILHLFGKLCQAVAGPEDAPSAPAFPEGWVTSGQLGASWLLARRVLVPGALAFALGGAALLLSPLVGVRLDARGMALAAGTALLILGFIAYLYALLARIRKPPARPVERRAWVRNAGPVGGGVAFALAFLLVAAGIAVAVTGWWSGAQQAGVALGIWVLVLALAMLVTIAFTRPSRQALRLGELEMSPDSNLNLSLLAVRNLQSIHFQQSFTSSWGAGLKALGGLKLPVELEAQFGQSSTLSPVAATFPDVVDGFQRFVSQTRKAYRVLIGIDELDKIQSQTKAREFLNDIKGVFGVPGCYFLISVSEDALASFERRGMPFRDVFDSAFDEIVPVPSLDLKQSFELLSQRVIGMPRPFMGLCYCLSGGLPRDLIRAARAVVSLPANTVKLPDVCRELVLAELPAKTDAVVRAITQVDTEPATSEAVDWSLRLDLTSISAPQLLAHCRSLDSYAGLRATAQASSNPRAPEAHVLRHVRELASYYYYSATVLEFFDASLDQDKLQGAEAPASAKESLDYLSGARRAFAVNSRLAWERVSAFRSAWSLVIIGFPFTAAAAATAAGRPTNGSPPASRRKEGSRH